LLPGSISDKVVGAYRKHLYGDTTLQSFPDRPRFVIDATNVQTGALFRFSKPYAADYRVGAVRTPRVALAIAVAASSAFPPVLSPLELEFEREEMSPLDGADLHEEPRHDPSRPHRRDARMSSRKEAVVRPARSTDRVTLIFQRAS
jgi:NTE family protein